MPSWRPWRLGGSTSCCCMRLQPVCRSRLGSGRRTHRAPRPLPNGPDPPVRRRFPRRPGLRVRWPDHGGSSGRVGLPAEPPGPLAGARACRGGAPGVAARRRGRGRGAPLGAADRAHPGRAHGDPQRGGGAVARALRRLSRGAMGIPLRRGAHEAAALRRRSARLPVGSRPVADQRGRPRPARERDVPSGRGYAASAPRPRSRSPSPAPTSGSTATRPTASGPRRSISSIRRSRASSWASSGTRPGARQEHRERARAPDRARPHGPVRRDRAGRRVFGC